MGEEIIGACRYCGQIAGTAKSFDHQDEADEWATAHCTCGRATQERRKKEMLADAHMRIDMLFGEESEEQFGLSSVDEETIALLKRAARDIIEGTLSTAQLKHPSYGKAEIGINSKGAITVKRSATRVCQL